jgi:SAM-dependent methyltransferase
MQHLEEWNNSYKNKQNHLFYPDETIVRFLSRYFRKQIDHDTYVDLRSWDPVPRALDAGCGIGRHSVLLDRYGFLSYGIDGSDEAVAKARSWLRSLSKPSINIVLGSLLNMPFESGFFDCVVSHAVLDSMSFLDATKSIREIERVTAKNGLIYFDLISGSNVTNSLAFAGEQVVSTAHEFGTVQSYFTYEKIQRLLDGTNLKIVEASTITRERVDLRETSRRWHIVCRRF